MSNGSLQVQPQAFNLEREHPLLVDLHTDSGTTRDKGYGYPQSVTAQEEIQGPSLHDLELYPEGFGECVACLLVEVCVGFTQNHTVCC